MQLNLLDNLTFHYTEHTTSLVKRTSLSYKRSDDFLTPGIKLFTLWNENAIKEQYRSTTIMSFFYFRILQVEFHFILQLEVFLVPRATAYWKTDFGSWSTVSVQVRRAVSQPLTRGHLITYNISSSHPVNSQSTGLGHSQFTCYH